MQLTFNPDIFFDFIGRLKIVTVVLGLLDLIFIAMSYVHDDSRDQAYLAFVVIFFFLSLTWVLGIMFGVFVIEDSHTKYDIIYHVCACVILLVTDIFFMVSIVRHGSKVGKFGIRIVAMITGFANSAIYGYLPWRLLKST